MSESSTSERLVSIVQRIERLEEDKAGIAADIAEIYAEAKGAGFEPKVLRKLIAMRKLSEADRKEQEALLDIYMDALRQAAKLEHT